jgi:geranylgeranyl pyrophosphate synthase
MGFAARLGATLGGADDARIERMATFGEQAGVALQMLDDLGCLFGEARKDKALEDLRGRRVTWAWAWASECLDALSYKQLVRLVRDADELPSLRTRLALAVGELGRERVHGALDTALGGLSEGGFDAAGISALTRELARLEKSYG